MNYNGAIEDTRIDELQKLDWKHEELFGMSSPVEWKEVSKIPKYTIRNQDGSGACGAFSACVALGRNEEFDNGKYVNLSPAFIYNLRVDKTREGMAMFNLFDIMKNYGSILDEALSSDNLSSCIKYLIYPWDKLSSTNNQEEFTGLLSSKSENISSA